MEDGENPFKLPDQDPDLYHKREFERAMEEDKRRELRELAVSERYRILTNPDKIRSINAVGEVDEEPRAIEEAQLHFPQKKETIREFIQRKREILLVKMNIEHKREKTDSLERHLQGEEAKLKQNEKKLEENLAILAKYEDDLKQSVEHAAKEAEEKAAKRAAKQGESNHLKDETDRVKSLFEKRSEELKLLDSYRRFVEELSPAELQKPPDKEGTFLTQRIPLLVPFKTPGQLLEAIESLEEKDVFLIEHEREVEEQLEVNKHQILQERMQVDKEVEAVSDKLRTLSKTQTQLEQKLDSAHARLRKTTEQLTSTDTNHAVVERVRRIYDLCAPQTSGVPSIVDMLRTVEECLERFILKRNLMDAEQKDVLKQREARQQKERRTLLVQELNKKASEERQRKNEKIQKRNQRVTKQVGRPPMAKSMISKQVKVSVVKEEDPEERDQREFLGE